MDNTLKDFFVKFYIDGLFRGQSRISIEEIGNIWCRLRLKDQQKDTIQKTIEEFIDNGILTRYGSDPTQPNYNKFLVTSKLYDEIKGKKPNLVEIWSIANCTYKNKIEIIEIDELTLEEMKYVILNHKYRTENYSFYIGEESAIANWTQQTNKTQSIYKFLKFIDTSKHNDDFPAAYEEAYFHLDKKDKKPPTIFLSTPELYTYVQLQENKIKKQSNMKYDNTIKLNLALALGKLTSILTNEESEKILNTENPKTLLDLGQNVDEWAKCVDQNLAIAATRLEKISEQLRILVKIKKGLIELGNGEANCGIGKIIDKLECHFEKMGLKPETKDMSKTHYFENMSTTSCGLVPGQDGVLTSAQEVDVDCSDCLKILKKKSPVHFFDKDLGHVICGAVVANSWVSEIDIDKTTCQACINEIAKKNKPNYLYIHQTWPATRIWENKDKLLLLYENYMWQQKEQNKWNVFKDIINPQSFIECFKYKEIIGSDKTSLLKLGLPAEEQINLCSVKNIKLYKNNIDSLILYKRGNLANPQEDAMWLMFSGLQKWTNIARNCWKADHKDYIKRIWSNFTFSELVDIDLVKYLKQIKLPFELNIVPMVYSTSCGALIVDPNFTSTKVENVTCKECLSFIEEQPKKKSVYTPFSPIKIDFGPPVTHCLKTMKLNDCWCGTDNATFSVFKNMYENISDIRKTITCKACLVKILKAKNILTTYVGVNK